MKNNDLHLDRVVHLWIGCKGVNCQVKLLSHVCQPPDYCNPQEVPEKFQ